MAKVKFSVKYCLDGAHEILSHNLTRAHIKPWVLLYENVEIYSSQNLLISFSLLASFLRTVIDYEDCEIYLCYNKFNPIKSLGMCMFLTLGCNINFNLNPFFIQKSYHHSTKYSDEWLIIYTFRMFTVYFSISLNQSCAMAKINVSIIFAVILINFSWVSSILVYSPNVIHHPHSKAWGIQSITSEFSQRA